MCFFAPFFRNEPALGMCIFEMKNRSENRSESRLKNSRKEAESVMRKFENRLKNCIKSIDDIKCYNFLRICANNRSKLGFIMQIFNRNSVEIS